MSVRKQAFFDFMDPPARVRLCDHPGCGQAGEYRAPKGRERLNEYYFFCLEHVREYNKAWDFFSGLSPDQIETYTRNATVWERPTWRLGQWGMAEQRLRDKAMNDIFGQSDTNETENMAQSYVPAAEREALSVLDLMPPIAFHAIKTRYRELVKKHHPDVHGADRENEERFKRINLAFATLRKIHTDE